MTQILPGTQVPALTVETLDGGTWRLQDQTPENFTFVIFYRGLHCPICRQTLRDYDHMIDQFTQAGVAVIAISTDTRERAAQSKAEWELQNVNIGYGLSIENARAWGLYISSSTKPSEPAYFAEPGHFLVRPDGTLYAAQIQSVPFARASAKMFLQSLQKIIESDYPARGVVPATENVGA
ncbi:MAG: AhpC/TSA family protein [Chloroflexi bacterium]|nr:AhpC/TSA family protein [Chloroflexota bacterium]